MSRTLIALLAAALVIAVAILVTAIAARRMVGMEAASAPPPVRGYYRGQEVLFIHTEASDPRVAEMLTAMTWMRSPVLFVPRLATVPEAALADVYVFTSGVSGMGPMGFQIDVFDSAPGDEGYSPLRSVQLVTWQEGSTPRELRSVDEIRQAAARGEVTIQHAGVVVNMPFLRWPGGQR
jgi:hypothetical protein